jgi:hypothetical protein
VAPFGLAWRVGDGDGTDGAGWDQHPAVALQVDVDDPVGVGELVLDPVDLVVGNLLTPHVGVLTGIAEAVDRNDGHGWSPVLRVAAGQRVDLVRGQRVHPGQHDQQRCPDVVAAALKRMRTYGSSPSQCCVTLVSVVMVVVVSFS